MLRFPLENNLFLLSSETLDAVVLLRYPHCTPVRPRSVLTPGAWAHTSSRMAIPYPRFTIIRTFEPSSTRLPRAAQRSAAPYSQTAASSDGSPPVRASSSGHASSAEVCQCSVVPPPVQLERTLPRWNAMTSQIHNLSRK
jgi:hypothetical protein